MKNIDIVNRALTRVNWRFEEAAEHLYTVISTKNVNVVIPKELTPGASLLRTYRIRAAMHKEDRLISLREFFTDSVMIQFSVAVVTFEGSTSFVFIPANETSESAVILDYC